MVNFVIFKIYVSYLFRIILIPNSYNGVREYFSVNLSCVNESAGVNVNM